MKDNGPVEITHISPPVAPPIKEIYARLGYNSERTSLSADEKNRIDRIVNEAYDRCSFSVYFRRFQVTMHNVKEVCISGRDNIFSESFYKFCEGCESLYVMAATSGGQISTDIQKLMESGHMESAVIYDAVASECTDALLDWTQIYISRQLSRLGKSISKNRFSPGYGDLTLEAQRLFFNLMELDKRGFSLTGSLLLLPEKSVIGIAAQY